MRNFLILATLFAAVFADDSSSCSNGVSASQDEVTLVNVTVGANGALRYSPDDIQVTPGNIVQFEFYPKNHTVTESSFDEPCVPLAKNLTSLTRPGVKSGFIPTNGTGDFIPAFRIMVNDTKPIWLYCGQKNPKPHCQAGMVMVINQNRNDTTNKTLDNFRAKAMAVPVPDASNSTSTMASYSGYSTATSAASAITPAAQSTTAGSGPALSASTTVTASSSVISVFHGAAAPTGQSVGLAALGGLVVAAAAML